MLLKIKKLEGTEDIPAPKYMTEGSVGMDLYASVTSPVAIEKGEIKLIPTGICLEIPEGFEGQVRPRSGLALKYGITLLNTPGTIDWDYRGEIKVIVINLGSEPFIVNRGERIAQIVFNKVEKPSIEIIDKIRETGRGSGGFGSTGV
ncbi:MAG: dUTP diphosphatase [Clostridiaceae bacterium]